MFQCVDLSWTRLCIRNSKTSNTKITVNRFKKNGNNSLKRNYSFGEEDPYRVLGVSRTASKEEIRKAYREMAKKTHPDHNKGSSTKDFLRVKKAFEAISSGNAGGQQQSYPKYSSSGGGGTQQRTSAYSSSYSSHGDYGARGGSPYGQSDRERYGKFYKEWDQNVKNQQAKYDYKFTQEEERRKDRFNQNSYKSPGGDWEEWLRHVDEINKNNERNRPREKEQWKAQVNRDSFFYGSTGFNNGKQGSRPNNARQPVNLGDLFQKYAEHMNINVKQGSIFDIIKGFFELQKKAEEVVREANNLLPRNLKMIQTGKTVMLQGDGNRGGSVTLPPFNSPNAASVLFWSNSILAQSRMISLQGSSLKMRVNDNSNNLLGHFTMTRTATIPLINIELGFKYVFHNADGSIISRGRSFHFLNLFNYFKFERRDVTLAKMFQFPLADSWKIQFHPSVAKEATMYTFAMAYQMLGGITQRSD
eukprot:TRINITY_DN7421_c0_g1_i1.p1 TRINITY_DN7421_c0_g1~~TRINITY_DN7421_c0_g1_i1.p1  ORF type:complete len:474 (-),score=149.74 TRINITY_DN7421_c0_g1_i1:18-1439(-)